MTEPLFLTLDEILAIHSDQIRLYGGRTGLRDLGLLQSALGMPETTFDKAEVAVFLQQSSVSR